MTASDAKSNRAALHDAHADVSDEVFDDCDDDGIPREWLPIICDEKHIGFLDYDGLQVPRITVSDQRYARVTKEVLCMKGLVDTSLDVFDDLAGRVFVRITIQTPPAPGLDDADRQMHPGTAASSPDTDTAGLERFMLDARRHLQFFEALAKNLMLAIVSERENSDGTESVVIVQMPRPDKVDFVLDLIRRGLAMG